MTRVIIEIDLKKGVTDPEGKNTQKALELLGFEGINSVKSSKLFIIDLATEDKKEAENQAQDMCKRLLANPVVHNYTMTIE